MAPSKPPPNFSLPWCATEHHSAMGIRREMLPETRVHHLNAQGRIPWVAYTAASTEIIQGGRKDRHHEHMDSCHKHHQGAGSAHKCHRAFRRMDCEHGQITIRASHSANALEKLCVLDHSPHSLIQISGGDIKERTKQMLLAQKTVTKRGHTGRCDLNTRIRGMATGCGETGTRRHLAPIGMES